MISHRKMAALSASLWLLLGMFLIWRGLTKAQFDLHCMAIGVIIGFLKGRFVLQRTALKQIARIRSLPNPAPLKQLYGRKFLILIAVMMGISVAMRFSGIDPAIRGTILIAVGFALIEGSTAMFKAVVGLKESDTESRTV